MTIQNTPSASALVQSQQSNARPVTTTDTLAASLSTTTQTSNTFSQSNITIGSTETTRPVQAAAPVQSISPEQAANNILQFIAGRLVELKSSGADEEQLQKSLSQARQGFEQGLSESKDILSSLGKLDEAQSSRLDQIQTQVNEGFGRIEKNLFSPTEASANTNGKLQLQDRFDIQVIQRESSQNSRQTERASTVGSQSSSSRNQPSKEFGASFQQYRSAFARQDTINLNIRTQDGDLVNIQFSASQSSIVDISAGSFTSNSRSNGQSNSIQADFLREFRQQFGQTQLNIGVQGEIDADELQALEELLNQLGDIANAFFSGDDGAALSEALSIEIDGSEIAQFSADFQSREVQQQTSLYREIAGFTRNQSNNNASNNPLLQQIRDFVDSQSSVSFTNASKTTETFIEQLLAISFAAASDSLNSSERDK